MDPIDILVREHDEIQRGLHLLHVAAGWLEKGRLPPAGFQAGITDFFRTYADRCHHAKEEGVLFPAMARRDACALAMPIRELEEEHVRFRGYVSELARLSLHEEQGRTAFVALAIRYVEELRHHIYVEHNDTFVVAHEVIRTRDELRLLSAFDRGEKATRTSGCLQRWLPRLARWERELG